jgi:glutamate/aspartate transport system substrate-binding protein
MLLATQFITALPAAAQTLQRIKESGVIKLGHRESSIPFAYYDDKQQVIGYSIDIAHKIVAAIQKELGLPKLEIKYIPVTTENRIPLIQSNAIDIECGSTSNTQERQQLVAFSNSLFVVGTRMLVRKSSGMDDFSDLLNKSVVVTAKTNAERIVQNMSQRGISMKLVVAKDHDEAFSMLDSGRAAAFVMDDALLFGAMARARNPGEWAVVGLPQSREAYGCMLPRRDPAFKKVVDAEIARIMTSGEGEQLFVKWFRSPIPPNGINFNIPLTDEMRAWMKKPNDTALDSLLPQRRPTSLTDSDCFRKVPPDPSCVAGSQTR